MHRQEGTPLVHATSSRPRLSVTCDGRGVVSHSGSRLLADLAEVTGLTGAFSEATAGLRERRSAHDPGRVLVDVAVLLA
ncbi:MAG: transposase, partial [Actinomycetota bacterium]|nr:transposase [Actinomycetota bacterium]